MYAYNAIIIIETNCSRATCLRSSSNVYQTEEDRRHRKVHFQTSMHNKHILYTLTSDAGPDDVHLNCTTHTHTQRILS